MADGILVNNNLLGGGYLIFKNGNSEKCKEIKYGSLVNSNGGSYNNSNINIPSNAIPIILVSKGFTTINGNTWGKLTDNLGTNLLYANPNSGGGVSTSKTIIYLPNYYENLEEMKTITKFYYSVQNQMYSSNGLEIIAWIEN